MIGVLDTAPYVAGALGAGGVGAFASRQRELIRRWGTWAITAPVVGGAMLLGAPGAAVLASALAVVAAAEYGRLARLPLADRVAMAAGLIAVMVVAAVAPGSLPKAVAAGAGLVALIPVVAGDTGDGARRAAYGVLGFGWLAALAGLVVLHGLALPLFFAVSVADVAAWCTGRAIRSPRLSRLSPAKGWSGAVGGAAAGIAVLGLLGALNPVTAIAVALAGPVGDLFESMLKRGAGVKDAGTWLPGFGGLLDRIDSVLAVLLVAAVLS
jgi:phosphatidate cytidylyltransferase